MPTIEEMRERIDAVLCETFDNSRIGAIILAIKAELDPYDPVTHRKVAVRKLLEIGYTEEDIRPWLDIIDDM